MRVSDFYAGNFYTSDDFDKDGRDLEIDSVELEKVGQDEKLTIHFTGDDGLLALNKTNALTISEAFGDDTDDWHGNVITIYRDQTMFGGKRVPCLRVKASANGIRNAEVKAKEKQIPF